MAIDILRKDITAAIKSYSDTKLRNLLGKTEIHEVKITAARSAQAFVQGTNNIMESARYDAKAISDVNTNYNTISSWEKVIADIYDELNTLDEVAGTNHELKNIAQLHKSKLKGVYLHKTSSASAMVVRLYNAGDSNRKEWEGDTNLNTFLAAYRRLAWNRWIKNLPKSEALTRVSVEKGTKHGTRFMKKGKDKHGAYKSNDPGEYASAAFGRGNPYAHDPETTVGSIGFERILEELGENQAVSEALQYKGLEGFSQDLVSSVMNTLELSFDEEEIIMPDGNTRFKRVIRGEFRGQGRELQDWRSIKKEILKPDGALATTLADKVAAMNEEQALGAEGSTSAKKKIAKRAGKKIVDNIIKQNRDPKTGRFVKVVKKQKEAPKPRKKKTGPIKTRSKRPAGRLSTAPVKIAIAGAILKNKPKKRTAGRKSKGSGEDNLLKVQRLIQKRLPAEVRRNMGRPALINRTGGFSNSVKLTQLRQTKTGISGDYTYTLTGGGQSKGSRKGVYSTFENTGERQWSPDYNPKDLITKSIRNLAVQYATQKFVNLRRV